MKRVSSYIYAIFLAIIIPNIFTACTWETPSNFSVKSKATYNYTIGNFEHDLHDELSKETLNEKMNKDDDKFSIYDYNPAGNSKSRQFLIEYPIKQIPLDMESYFSRMDFAQKLEKKNIDKDIAVPDIKTDDKVVEVAAPDINAIICNKSHFSDKTLPLPTGVTLTEDTIGALDIDFTSPDFTTLTFCAGTLDITAISDSDPIATSLNVTLCKTDGSEITKKTGVDLSQSNIIQLPLAGKTLYHDMKLKISGNTLGEAGDVTDYTLKVAFNPNIKVTKATGLTMSESELGEDGATAIDEKVPIDAGDDFVSCVIGDDGGNKSTLIMTSTNLPSNWSGVKCKKVIGLTGAMMATDEEFDKSRETQNDLLDRTLLLNGKALRNGDINITGTVEVSFEDATIITNNGEVDPIKVTVATSIKAFSSVTVDLGESGEFDATPTQTTEPFPANAAQYLKEVMLKPSGFDIKYTNTLPAGNDITLNTASEFFGISNKAISMTGGGAATTQGAQEVRGVGKKVVKEFPDIDFTVGLNLPGATSDSPSVATFYNLKVGEGYKVAIEITPYIDYEYVVLDTNNVGASSEDGPIDTGLNFNEMFSGVLDVLNQSEDFTKRLNLQRMPLYLYAVIPDITPGDATDETLFDRISFSGRAVATLSGETKSDPIYVVGSASESETVKTISKMPTLTLDKNNEYVITDVSTQGVSSHDVAALFNSHEDGTVIMTYDFRMADKGGATDGVVIYKEEIDRYKKDNDANDVYVGVDARIVLPLELEVMEGEDGDDSPLDFQLSNLIYASDSTDLLGRDGATGTSDFDKYIDAAKSAGAHYVLTNKFLIYDGGQGITAIMDANSEGAAYPVTSLGDNGKITVDCSKNSNVTLSIGCVRDILHCECFHPLLSAQLPLGKCYIPIDSYMNVQFNLFLKTSGTVSL